MGSKPIFLILFLLISGLIVSIWFKDGTIYGGAEVGLAPYNPQRWLEISKYVWWEAASPGQLIPHFIVGVPFYFYSYLLQLIGLSTQIIQQVFFFVILFLMGYGMYLLTLYILDDGKKRYAILAGLFYMFNSYTMVMIWHRFLYTGFFLAAFLPFFALFWKKWINTGQFLFLGLFLLTNLVSLYMFGNLASVLTVWLLILLITSADAIFPLRKNELVKIGLRSFLGVFFWLVTNIWWLIPVVGISTGLLSEQHSSEDNINTLINIGKQTILPFTLQFANPFYLFHTAELGQIYNSLFFKILPWIPILVIFIGLLVSFKQKSLAKLSLIYLLVIIFSKGPTSPFGYPYLWGFMNIYALGVIRNPFEKLGILLPFFGSTLFVVGLAFVYSWGIKKIGLFGSRLLTIMILLSILIYAWPMFTGKVISKPLESLRVNVPLYYKQADDFLKDQKEKEGNILHLPFSGRDVVTYNWQHGYHGVDINQILFTSLPSISRNMGLKRVDDTLKGLTLVFNNPLSKNKDLVVRLLQDLNIKFIVLHKEVKWTDISTYGKDIRLLDPLEMEVTLNNYDFLERQKSFGDLIIYKLKDIFFKPKIEIFETASLVYPGENSYLEINTFTIKDNIITPQNNNLSGQTLSKIKDVLLFPESSLNYSVASESAMIEMVNNPDSLINQLTFMKNYFSQTGLLMSEELTEKILKATKILFKLFNSGLASPESYENLLTDIFKNNFKDISLLKLFKNQIINTFYAHLYILEKSGRGQSASKILIEGLKENNLLPLYLQSNIISDKEINKRVARFKVPFKSKYELLIASPKIIDLYPDFLTKLDIRINDNTLETNGKLDKNIISFGELDFDENTYEISYNSLLSPNLLPSIEKNLKMGNVQLREDSIHLTSGEQGIAYLEAPLRGVSGNDIYNITFDVLFEKGNEFYIEIMQDSEDFDNQKVYQTVQANECSVHTCYPIKLDPTKSGWQKYSLLTTPLNSISQRANFRIIVFSKFENSQQIHGDVFIKNLQVNRVFDGEVVLRKKISDGLGSLTGELISINHQTPVSYFGKIRLSQPSFLIFKETFHPGWSLTLTQGDQLYKIDKHFMGNLYANSYFIDKIGEYNFKLEFEPQKGVDKGLLITTFGWFIVLAIFIWSQFKRKRYEND